MIKELRIVEQSNKTIFDQEVQYVIPRYQRAYAWEDDEIVQLIDDISDVASDNYYIGTLVVSRTKGDSKSFEVVDGQQRLTTLYLLLNYIAHKQSRGEVDNEALIFDCRKRSNYTLQNIRKILSHNLEQDVELIENSIINGLRVIRQTLESESYKKVDFFECLKRVVLYRIEVPEHTDLNKYFEIMNTRGEQLEQSDILKARLMGFLMNNREGQEILAKVWDSCSDMTGYVQMHFKKDDREKIFGENWSDVPKNVFTSLESTSNNQTHENDHVHSGSSLYDIIRDRPKSEEDKGANSDDEEARFESIISFPNFLLHAIRLFVSRDEKLSENVKLGSLLDDKKLISDFNLVVNNGIMNSYQLGLSKESFAKEFIQHLLQLRYLFDNYIIKRESTGEDSDGKWSLKELNISNGKAYFSSTVLIRKGEEEERNANLNKECLMLQSALRVSYTSPKVMHWITELLQWLLDNYQAPENLSKEVERIAAEAARPFIDEGNYKLGVQTPRIVFNFLDYLLWKKDKNNYSDFKFEFRNSVEHWYPRHPSEGTFDPWAKIYDTDINLIDTFGNLCLITRRVNSRFSNQSPKAKSEDNSETVKSGSIKLRIMSSITNNSNDNWDKEACLAHQKEMIDILKEACSSLL